MTSDEYISQHGLKKTFLQTKGITWTDNKIIIPVLDASGTLLFNKYRHLTGDAKFSFDKGSTASLYNAQLLEKSDVVFIVEGEPDALRLEQDGFVAVCTTNGATHFKEEWKELFVGKKVYILYDNDKAGKLGRDLVSKYIPRATHLFLPTEFNDVCEYFQEHTKSDFESLIEIQVKRDTLSYIELCAVFEKWLLIADQNVIRILLASLIAHHFETDPLWIFFVAPSSGSKTEIITTVSDLDFTYLLSDLTPQTLVSGMPTKKDHDPSLLSQLKNHVLVMKDFTTVLSMRHEDKGMILAQLREIYDGHYKKTFGTGKTVDWHGRLTLIAGVTTIIDMHSMVFQTMGERFLMYRIPQAKDVDVAKRALSNYGHEKEMREELKSAVSKYFYSLHIPSVSDIELPQDIIDSLSTVASWVVRARSGIIRDGFKKELVFKPIPEAPARFAKQLGTLAKALAVLAGRTVVTLDDYYMVLKVAFDVIPSNRTEHLLALCGETHMTSTTHIAQKTSYSRPGSNVILEDLTALNIVKVKRGGSGQANIWGLSRETYTYFKDFLPKKAINIESIFPEDSPYYPLIVEIQKGKELQSEAEEVTPDELDDLFPDIR